MFKITANKMLDFLMESGKWNGNGTKFKPETESVWF